MDLLNDSLMLSRLQFAVTAMFHILWPLLTVGLSIFLVAVEVMWLKTADKDYLIHAKFWAKLLLLNIGIGVVSGIPLEFEFGTNWAPFSRLTGEFFGNILGYEGATALMLEAGFLGLMMLGWNKVSAGMHLFATSMVAFGSSLSAFWVMIANGWLQEPGGGHVEAGRYVVDSYAKAIFNPDYFLGFAHMWMACVETSLFVVAGISAGYMLRNCHITLFRKSFGMALAGLLLIAPMQILIGDLGGLGVFRTQPAKAAAIEAHWETNKTDVGADWHVIGWPDKAMQTNRWMVGVPNGLSLIATRTLRGKVLGLKEFAPADQPPAIPLIFYSFRVMVAVGLIMAGLSLLTGWLWWKRRKAADDWVLPVWLLKSWVAAIPLGYVATECGWLVREVGRQPWVVYGLLRTEHAASNLPVGAVATSLVLFVAIYTLLLAVFLLSVRRIVITGPNINPQIPVFAPSDGGHSSRETED